MELIPIVAGGLLVVGFLMMVVAAVMLIARKGKKSGAQAAAPKVPSRGPGKPPAPPPRRGQDSPAPPMPPRAAAPPPPARVMPAPAAMAPPPRPPVAAAAMPPPPPPAMAPAAAPPPVPEPDAGHTVAMDPSEFMPATLAQPRPGYYGRFVGVRGVLEGREVPIDETGFVIGRDHTLAQLVISDPRVSKKHCWVGVRGGEVWVIDQGSTNGTYVNDVNAGRITERRLDRGDVVIVSEDVARFEFRLD